MKHSKSAVAIYILPLLAFAAEAQESAIEEVVVTATKQETRAQDTAIALTAFSAEHIERDQIKDLRDLQLQVPGLVFSQASNIGQVSLRGVGVDFTSVVAESGIAINVDGVYQPTSFQASQPFTDLQAIEVLRGPQGTLYGRNATGGAINFVSKTASYEPEISVGGMVGSDNQFRGEISLNGPLAADRVAGRISFLHDQRDSYFDNDGPGELLDVEYNAVRGSMRFDFGDAANLIIRGYWSELEGNGPVHHAAEILTFPLLFGANPLNPNPLNPANALSPGRVSNSESRVFHDTPETNDVTQQGINATLSIPILGGELRSITAYTDVEMHYIGDLDGTDLGWFSQNADEQSETFSQELNFFGSTQSGNFSYTLGAFYLNSDANGLYQPRQPATTDFYAGLFSLITGGPFDPVFFAFIDTPLSGTPIAEPFFDFLVDQDTESVALYAEGKLAVTEKLSTVFGVRWSRDKKEADQFVVGNILPVTCRNLEFSDDWSSTTPKIALEYDYSENVLIYASATKGFKGGGLNPFGCGNDYDQEELLSYEFGYKGSLAGGRMNLNITMFYYDYEDMQVQEFLQGGVSVTNAGKSEVTGAEGELEWLVTSNLRVSGFLGYLDTEYKQGSAFDAVTAFETSIAGNDLTKAPKIKAHIGLTYDVPVGAGSLALHANASHSSSYFLDATNNPINRQDSFEVFNARVTYTSPDERYEIELWGRNLANEHYFDYGAISSAIGGLVVAYNNPRTYGLRLKWTVR